MQVAGFTLCFSTVRKHLMPLYSVNGILPCQTNLIDMLFHVIFGRPCPFLPATSKSNALLKISPLSLLKTCPYYRTPLALASPFKVFFKPSKLISSWLLLFSMILTPQVALIMDFSVLLKTSISFFLRHHVSLSLLILRNSDKFFLAFLTKTFSHEVTAHIL